MEASRFPLRLVPVAEADLEIIAALVNRAFATHPFMRGGNRTSPDGLRYEAAEAGEFLVSEREGRIVASAMIRACHPELDAPETAIDYQLPTNGLYFGLAAVEPELMSSGGGRALLTEAERIARERGHTHVVLTTLYEFGLPPYYERFGYVTVANEDFPESHWGMGAPHRMAHMEKAL